MKAVVQRVAEARVVVAGELVGSIERGLLVLLGVAEGDGEDDFQYLLKKISGLRVFSDVEGKMNVSVSDIKGKILLVSQFTLLADTKNGNRPSFMGAAKPEVAEKTYVRFGTELEKLGIPVQWGKFGGEMKVYLCNEGPVTILFDSRDR